MNQLMRCAGFVIVALALIVPTFAGQAQKVPDPKKDGEPKKVDGEVKKKDDKKAVEPKEKFVYGSKFIGKIKELDKDSGSDLTIEITYKVGEPNADAQRQMAQHQQRLQQLQVDLARAKNLQERADRQRDIANVVNQMAQAQRDLVRYKDVTVDYKLRLTENAKVRLNYPPLDYDDKGNVKKYTAKELAAMRGAGGFPGYPAEKDHLRAGQVVEVYLAANKSLASPKGAVDPKTGKALAKKKVDDGEPAVNSNRPEVVLVLIIQEPMK